LEQTSAKKKTKKKIRLAFEAKKDITTLLLTECATAEKLLYEFSDTTEWEKTNKGENFWYFSSALTTHLVAFTLRSPKRRAWSS
jgi:hypothetical protein